MLYPEKMSKVTIAAPKGHIEEIIKILYNLNALHIKNYKGKELSTGSPLKNAEKISEILLDITSIKTVVNIKGKQKPANITLNESESFISGIREKSSALYEKKKELQEKDDELKKRQKTLLFLKEAGITNFDNLSGYKTLEMMTGYIKKPIKDENIVTFSDNKEKSPAVLFFKKDDKRSKQLIQRNLIEERLDIDGKGTVSAAIDIVSSERETLKQDKLSLKSNIDEIVKEKEKILSIESRLREDIQKSEVPLTFGTSKNAFTVEGWVPSKNVEKVREGVEKITPSAFVQIEDAKSPDTPTKINNPKVMKPFEFFLDLYSLPKFNELDPTWMIFLSFPIFYGFMLGDMGYGLVILLLALGLRPKFKNLRAVIDVSILSALSTIAFGYVFGEFFGAEEIFGYHLTPIFHRLEHVSDLILASAALGFVHINLGFILGFVNEYKHHGMVKAILAKASWMLFEAGAILIALITLGYLDLNIYIPAGIMIIAFLMIAKGEGIIGVFEIPSLLANILSYARLAAIGLASASLALLVNKMAGPMFSAGILGVVGGTIILVLGHSINMAIGIMDAFLQSMRLHYVELFGKFYGGSGKPYRPFGQHNK